MCLNAQQSSFNCSSICSIRTRNDTHTTKWYTNTSRREQTTNALKWCCNNNKYTQDETIIVVRAGFNLIIQWKTTILPWDDEDDTETSNNNISGLLILYLTHCALTIDSNVLIKCIRKLNYIDLTRIRKRTICVWNYL